MTYVVAGLAWKGAGVAGGWLGALVSKVLIFKGPEKRLSFTLKIEVFFLS